MTKVEKTVLKYIIKYKTYKNKMNLRKIEKYIKKIITLPSRKKKTPKRNLISIRESDNNKFKKRRKKAILKFFRKFSIPFWKTNILYYSIGLGFVCVMTIGVLIFSPFFNIKGIYITRTNTNVNIDMAYQAVDYLRGKKIFLLDQTSIKDAILQTQKNIKDINISLKIPSNLEIQIHSYDTLFQTTLLGKPYSVLSNGSVIPKSSSRDIPFVYTYLDEESIPRIPDYKKIFSERYIESIIAFKNSLVENMIQIQIVWLHYYVAERELIIELQDGGDLIFDLTKDKAPQIEKIVIFNRESGDITKRNLIYTDLRIDNKVFFCDISSEFLCRVNFKNIYGNKQERIVVEDSEITSVPAQ